MIRPETISLVKERTDLVALIGETVRLTRRGRTFVGLCPFHKEKTPSFHVNPERAIFHCFGCKESGSSIDFVMKTEGRTFPEAIRMLAERAGIQVEDTGTAAEQKEAAAARRAKDDLYGANQLAATFFEHCLNGGPGGVKPHPLARYAHDELGRRGLVPTESGDGIDPIADALQAFRVGYAPFGWDGLAAYFKQHGISPVTAERAGLLVPRSSGSGHYDRFRHRLMFAVTDVNGRVIAFSGRALDDPSPAELEALDIRGPSTQGEDGRGPAKYINSPESPVYTKGEHLFGLHQARHAVRTEGEAVLVEGNFDVVALHARGVKNVVAPLGTAFTTPQAKLLKRFAPTVIVLFDGDAAGRKATRASRVPCREGGLAAKVATLPPKMDPDELVRDRGPEALTRIVKNARGMLEYLMADALDPDAFQGATMTEQVARVRAAVELLREEQDPTLRLMADSLANQLSNKLVIHGKAPADLRDLHGLVVRATSEVPQPPPADGQSRVPHDRARSRPQEEQIPLEMLGALLDFPELLDDDEVADAIGVLTGDVALAVVALRQNLRRRIARPNSCPPPRSAGWHDSAHDPGSDVEEAQGLPGAQKGIYTDEFLAQIARSIHPFAVGRSASPRYEHVGEAKGDLLSNAQKLMRLSFKRENAQGVEQLQRTGAEGDVASELAILADVERRAKKRHGLA